MQWNARGLMGNGAELRNQIAQMEDQPDVICIQETFLKTPKEFTLDGYNEVRKDREDRPKGGLITFIKEGIAFQELKAPNDIECQVIQVSSRRRKIVIIHVYNSPGNKIDEDAFENLFKHRNAIILGDFNAKSPQWQHKKYNAQGEALERIMDKCELVLINSGESTYQKEAGGASVLDLSMVSSNLAVLCSWSTIRDTLGSDHMPAITTINEETQIESTVTERWKTQKADWSKFKAACLAEIKPGIEKSDIESMKEEMKKVILSAAEASIPKTIQGRPKKVKAMPFWTSKCDQITKERNAARNKFNNYKSAENQEEYQRLKGEAQKTIKDAKAEQWENFCNELDQNDKLGPVWEMSKKMAGNNNSKRSLPTLKKDQRLYETNEEKADLLAETFARISSDQNYSAAFLTHKSDFEEKNQIEFTDDSTKEQQNQPINEEFSMDELQEAIKNTKANSAPGGDTISYSMIKELPDKANKQLLNLFNEIWKEGTLPREWKHAIITPVRKPEKEQSDPTSYRPISLTSSLCKVLEKMITSRLQWYLESNNLLAKEQTGFRRGKGTTDQIIKLHDQIHRYINNKGYTVGVFLDFEKAYDMLWRKGLMTKIKKLGINGNMFAFIKDFITERTFQVQVGDHRSKIMTLDNGTPQGSVISPLLFLIMINDMRDVTTGVHLSLFADDSATYKSGKNLRAIMNEIQTTIGRIQDWCQKWGFKISTQKSCTVIFSRKRQEVSKQKKISIDGTEIETVQQVKFLGMIFDAQLTWEEHVKYTVTKCRKRLNLMRSLAGTNWGASKKCQLTLYRALIRSLLDYGAIAYDSAAQTHKEKLQTIQNMALRIASGAIRGTSAAALQVDCGEPPLVLRRRKQLLQYAVKVKFDPSHPNASLLLDHWTNYYGKYKPGQETFVVKTREIIEKIETPKIELCKPSPPWINRTINIDLSLAEAIKKQDGAEKRKEKIDGHMEKLKTRLQIYTDAAKAEDGKVTTAYHIPEIGVHYSCRITDNTSVDTAELIAIQQSIRWIKENEENDHLSRERKIVILSDSQTALRTLKNPKKENTALANESLRMINEINKNETSISWIPGHAGIEGNEKTDEIAKKALRKNFIEKTITPGDSEAYKEIEKMVESEWQQQWTSNKNGAFFRKIQPTIGRKTSYSNKNRKKEVSITRLRFGKTRLNEYMHKIGLHQDGKCNTCKVAETVEHYVMECQEAGLQDKVKEACRRTNTPFEIQKILAHSDILDVISKHIKRPL